MKTQKPMLPDTFEWCPETLEWFEAWRSSRATDRWNDRQWQYMFDTAIVHSLVYGAQQYGFLGELSNRLKFMGLYFDQE